MAETKRGGPRPKVRPDDGRATNGGIPGSHQPGAGRPPKLRTVHINGQALAGLWTVKIDGDNVYLESARLEDDPRFSVIADLPERHESEGRL